MSSSNGPDPAISVVVPVRNEAGNIASLVAEIVAALQGRVFEVVYVNDGSKDATEQELRAFLSQRIAAFKTPRKILFLTEIPKGATGKLQRIGLAEKLGLV